MFQLAAFAVFRALSPKSLLLLSLTVLPLTQAAPNGADGVTWTPQPPSAWQTGVYVWYYSTSSQSTAMFEIDTSTQHWDSVTMDVGAYIGIGSTIGDGKTASQHDLGSMAAFRPFTLAFDGQAKTYRSLSETPIHHKLDPNHVYSISLSTDDFLASGLYVRSIALTGGNVDPFPDANTTTSATSSLTASSTSSTSSTSSVSSSTQTGSSTLAILLSTISTTVDPSMLGNPTISIGSVATDSSGNSNINASTGSSNSSSNSKKTSTIVGVVLGLLALVVLAIFLVILYRRKKQKDRIPPSMAFLNSYRDGPAAGAAGTTTTVGGDEKARPLGLTDEPAYGPWGGNNSSVIESGALFNVPNTAGTIGAGAAYGAASYTQRQQQQQQQQPVMPEDRYSTGLTNLATWPAPPTSTTTPAAAAAAIGATAMRDPRASEVDLTADPYGGIEMATTPPPAPSTAKPGVVLMQGNGMPTPQTQAPAGANYSQSPYGNPFLGPSEENMAGRGAGHWNRANV